MKKYTIVHSNTDVRKLWKLAKNGLLDRRTVDNIFKNDNDGFITFNSRYTYDKFIALQYSASAMY